MGASPWDQNDYAFPSRNGLSTLITRQRGCYRGEYAREDARAQVMLNPTDP